MVNLEILKWKNKTFSLIIKHSSFLNNITLMPSKIYTMSRFQKINSDNFKLPVIVSGRLITSGKYNEDKYGGEVDYPSKELMDSVHLWEGVKIYKSHGSWMGMIKGDFVPIDDIVGKILKTTWNERDNGIDYVAAIYDRDIAYKIASELINQVSVGFTSDVVWISGIPTKTKIVPR